jgi:DNA-binding transcriptional MerR regulator
MYKLGQVADAVGVNVRVLGDWLDRGIVAAPKTGTGTHRRFSKDDAVRVGIIADMTRLGLPIADAAKAASAFADQSHGGGDIGELFSSGKTVLLVDADGARVINVDDREQFDAAMLAVYEDVRTVTVVNVSGVVARVDRALASGTTQRGSGAMIYRHGRQLHV